MLNKNIYITYPAGYHGSYIHWAINKSNISTSANTVDDPLNLNASKQYGGEGTSHQHIRIPSHFGVNMVQGWIIKNRPEYPLIYLTNVNSKQLDRTTVATIIRYMKGDDTGIFINIHDETDYATKAYGRINCVMKWPTYLALVLNKRNINDIDVFDCADNRKLRNLIVTGNRLILDNEPVNHEVLDRELQVWEDWYKLRSRLQPHEINKDNIVTNFSINDRLFEISCRDIPSLKFIPFLNNFLEKSGVSDDWDTSYVEQYHHHYIEAQPNLQWFISFNGWLATGNIDEYLSSHVIIEAQLIEYMLDNKPNKLHNWENLSIHEINNIYQN